MTLSNLFIRVFCVDIILHLQADWLIFDTAVGRIRFKQLRPGLSSLRALITLKSRLLTFLLECLHQRRGPCLFQIRKRQRLRKRNIQLSSRLYCRLKPLFVCINHLISMILIISKLTVLCDSNSWLYSTFEHFVTNQYLKVLLKTWLERLAVQYEIILVIKDFLLKDFSYRKSLAQQVYHTVE